MSRGRFIRVGNKCGCTPTLQSLTWGFDFGGKSTLGGGLRSVSGG